MAFSDIPANISETRLKDRLEEAFEEGIIAVERDGTCAGFQWKVTWTTSGGNHPPMQVSGNGLTGSEVVIEAQTNEDGILYLDPNTIPGEFLRMPKASGEVSKRAEVSKWPVRSLYTFHFTCGLHVSSSNLKIKTCKAF